MQEINLQKRILTECNGDGVRLWQNDNGTAYRGKVTRVDGGAIINPCKMITYGLCPGSPDLVGMKRVTVTEDMVGKDVALFVGIEVKMPNGRLSEKQKKFLSMLNDMGAIHGVAKSVEDAEEILSE